MEKTQPSFDIIVPTYNRYEALPLFFQKLEGLDKNEYVLWLIDDASDKVNSSAIPEWENIHFIQLDKNGGQAGARNIAIVRGSAPYLISLDDDAWFIEPHSALLKIKSTFERHSDAGCLMFNIRTPVSNYKECIDGMELPLHVTCGCAYRRIAIEKIGGYSAILQGQSEETDISLRLIKMGYKLRSLYSIKIFHDFDPGHRSKEWYLRIRFKNTRNDLAVVYMNYPLSKLVVHLPGKALSHLRFALKNKLHPLATIVVTLKAWLAFLFWLPRLPRNPMLISDFDYWYGLMKRKR